MPCLPVVTNCVSSFLTGCRTCFSSSHFLVRDFVDSRKRMVKEQRKQQRRRERRRRQERLRSERALKSFHNAVRALTPPAAPREPPASRASSAHFSVTPCSSWYQEGEPVDEAGSPHLQNTSSEDLDAEYSYQSRWSSASQSHSETVTPKKYTPSPPNMNDRTG